MYLSNRLLIVWPQARDVNEMMPVPREPGFSNWKSWDWNGKLGLSYLFWISLGYCTITQSYNMWIDNRVNLRGADMEEGCGSPLRAGTSKRGGHWGFPKRAQRQCSEKAYILTRREFTSSEFSHSPYTLLRFKRLVFWFGWPTSVPFFTK